MRTRRTARRRPRGRALRSASRRSCRRPSRSRRRGRRRGSSWTGLRNGREVSQLGAGRGFRIRAQAAQSPGVSTRERPQDAPYLDRSHPAHLGEMAHSRPVLRKTVVFSCLCHPAPSYPSERIWLAPKMPESGGRRARAGADFAPGRAKTGSVRARSGNARVLGCERGDS